MQLLVKAFVEFLGTFVLVHAVCLAFNQVSMSASPALASGLCLAFLVYSFGHISGGHFNPAVSTGVWIGGGCDFMTWAMYLFAQFTGGIVGGVVAAKVATDGPFPVFSSENHDEGLWMEFLFTFIMVTTHLNCSLTMNGSYADNSFFGMAVGFVFIVAMFLQSYVPAHFGRTFSSGALNPALFIGANIGSKIFGDRSLTASALVPDVGGKYWAYFLLAEFSACIIAGWFFVMTEQCVVAHHKGYGSTTEEETTEVVNKPSGGYRAEVLPAEISFEQGNHAIPTNYGNGQGQPAYVIGSQVEMTY